MEEILRNTFATKQTAEVAFMHSFTSNIMPHIQMAHADEIHPTVGATFSVTMQNLEQMSPIFKRDSPTSFSWRTPTRRRLTTVVLRSICDINRAADGMLQEFYPRMAADTAGKLVLHFFKADDAAEFVRMVQSRGA